MTDADKPIKTIIIQGITEQGRKFRPSDWAERMGGMLSTFGKDHRIHYSPMLRPVNLEGVKCLAVDPALEQDNPLVFSQVMDFARRNQLKIIESHDELAPH